MRIIAGTLKGRRLHFVKNAKVRPLSDKVKGALYSILFTKVIDANMLDLFCGSGQVGIEALSRGAKYCDFVDLHVNVPLKNLKELELNQKSDVFKKNVHDAVKIIGKKEKKYDIVFIGAPYGYNNIDRLLYEIDEINILKEDGMIILEHRKGLNFDLKFKNLKLTRSNEYGQTILTFYQNRQDLEITEEIPE